MAARALARVNLAAIERNCRRLRGVLAQEVALCAVVKADGYGHGALAAARAARAGGATWLAVATADEAAALRSAGVDGPLLVMGPLDERDAWIALDADADVVAWRIDQLGDYARASGGRAARVHVKLDTGMGRLGTRERDEADAVVDAVAAAGLELAGAMTHFATADDPDDAGFFADQLARFEDWVAALRERHPGVVLHAANSAATLRDPRAHFDMVRAGIAIYGMDPANADPAAAGLEPALELTSYVAEVKRCRPGETVGYGRRFRAEQDVWIATVPIGYGDGVRRALTNNGEVLIGGRRAPILGTVSMDNITVGVRDDVRRGDRVTLIGSDGAERITAEDVARRIGTINYEVTCGISPRAERFHHRDGEAA